MEILIKSVAISLAIVGLRIVSSKGMLLYFLRAPYDTLIMFLKWCKEEQNKLTRHTPHTYFKFAISHLAIIFIQLTIYILKPIIACVTCMASVWTIAIDLIYYQGLDIYTPLKVLIVACMNSIIYALYTKLIK